ncbi:undecaprenyl diphosphate synthase family protein [Streptomyces sp. NPDC048521]|uniref:undecaprenyl diphosphate synthase family protein n=1 Tax=Streptomyces sp. NPDC048521 TaxID=3365566 RepID=UPI003716514E
MGDEDDLNPYLLWRTGNEQRVSNFPPWHAAYAKLYFTPGYWPDNHRRDLWRTLTEALSRCRVPRCLTVRRGLVASWSGRVLRLWWAGSWGR